MLTVGLVVFGVATYSFYSRSQYKRLDEEVRASMPLVSQELDQQAGRGGAADRDGGRRGGGGGPGGGGPPPLVVAPGTYGELRDSSGAVVTNLQLSTNTSPPKLPSKLTADGRQRLFSSGDYRVLVSPGPGPGEGNQTVVVAVPMTDVTESLHRLLYVEIIGGLVLLAALSMGSWLILRRGLHPLEEMATTARTITAGDDVDLSRRVSPSGGPTEVGQLGLALNTM